MAFQRIFARRRAGLITAVAVAAAVLCAFAGHSEAAGLSGTQVKAWLVVNFVKFTDWPQGRPATVSICVIGQDAIAPALAEFDGRSVAGMEVRVAQSVTAADAAQCQVAYVGASEERRLGAVLPGLAGHAVLTVSDLEGFAEQGGMIGIVPVDDRYVFDVNLDASHAAGIQPGTAMLRLARRVINSKGH